MVDLLTEFDPRLTNNQAIAGPIQPMTARLGRRDRLQRGVASARQTTRGKDEKLLAMPGQPVLRRRPRNLSTTAHLRHARLPHIR